jgi:septum formation protein
VIGADQVLHVKGRLFAKSATMEEVREDLEALRGRWHTLISAVAVAKGGTIAWRGSDSARLKMRRFSDSFLDWYLASAGPAVMASLGGYMVEGPGIHLFERIQGDYFTILGLPLLPVMAYLREAGFLTS